MGQDFLLVEGVNLYANIYDTDQLSIIRGGSFLFKDAIAHITKQQRFRNILEPVSTGASSGLFRLGRAASRDRKAVATEVFEALRNDQNFRHLTFLVEHCEADNVLQAKQQLWAQLHFRQLRSLTVTPDVFSERNTRLKKPSELEGTRIAAARTERNIQGDRRELSLSEFARWKYGRGKKQSHYFDNLTSELSAKLEGFSFAPDIETLCKHPGYLKLNGKMAVIYADGNGFGKRQRDSIQQAMKDGSDGIAAQQAFDKLLQQHRNRFLGDMLEQMLDGRLADAMAEFTDDDEEDGGDQQAIRLETLLWGGDEMLLVVPAWLGMGLLQQFFRHAKTWDMEDGGEPLTHAAGIVFCKASTPIRIIQNIARKLAERVKDKYGREQDAWDYLVLESVDYPTSDSLDDYFRQRYHHLDGSRPKACLAAQDWSAIGVGIQQLQGKEGLPIRQLYRIVDAFNAGSPAGNLTWDGLFEAKADKPPQYPQESAEFRMLRTLGKEQRDMIRQKLPPLAARLFGLKLDSAGQRAWCWLHLLELWDYLLPAKGETA